MASMVLEGTHIAAVHMLVKVFQGYPVVGMATLFCSLNFTVLFAYIIGTWIVVQRNSGCYLCPAYSYRYRIQKRGFIRWGLLGSSLYTLPPQMLNFCILISSVVHQHSVVICTHLDASTKGSEKMFLFLSMDCQGHYCCVLNDDTECFCHFNQLKIVRYIVKIVHCHFFCCTR